MGRFVGLLTPCAWLLAASTLWAQAEILKVVPEHALGFAVLNRLAATTGKIEKLGLRVHAPIPALLPMGKMLSGITAGLNEAGTLAIALMPAADADKEPVPVVFVPVTDYAKFVASLNPDDAAAEIIHVTVANQPSLVIHKGSFAVFSRPEDEEVLKGVKAAATGLEKLAEPLSKWLVASDASVLLLPKGVALAAEGLRTGLAQTLVGMQAVGGQQAEQLKPAIAMFDLLQEFIEDSKDEITHAGIGLSIDDRGTLSMTGRATFLPAGDFATSVAKADWPKQNPLTSLPAGPFAIASGVSMPTAWAEAFFKLNVQAMSAAGGKDGGKMTDEQIEKLRGVTQLIFAHSTHGINGGMIAVAPPEGEPQGIFQSMAGAFSVDDSSKYLKNYQKAMISYNELAKELDQPNMPTYEIKPVEVAGMRGVQMSFDAAKMIRQQQENNPAAPIMEKLFGGEVTAYVVAVNEHMVGMAYGNKGLLERINETVQSPSSGLASESTVVDTTKLLPEGAQWTMYISPSGMVKLVNDIAKAINGELTIPPFVETPPLGVGLKLAPTGLDARFVVPAPVIDALGDYIVKVQQVLQER